MNSFIPTWQKTWTAEEAENQLKNFKFSGPGWYLSDSDSMLVIPSDWEDCHTSPMFKGIWTKGDRFVFYMWNGFNPGYLFGEISYAPTRQDTRS